MLVIELISRPLILAAAAILPSQDRARYAEEWLAELLHARTTGAADAIGFAFRTARAAPQTALALRSGSALAFLEMTIACMALAVSTALAMTYWVIVGAPFVYAVPKIVRILAFLMVGVGVWRDERGLFVSRLARVGLLFYVFSRIVGIAMETSGSLVTPAEGALLSVAIPAILVTVGPLVLLAAGRTGRLRPHLLQGGLVLTFAGAVLWFVVELANAVAASTLEASAYHVIPLVGMAGIAYATGVLLRRPAVVAPQSNDVEMALQ